MEKEHLESLMMIIIEHKMASETNIEEVIYEFKMIVPLKRRLELQMFSTFNKNTKLLIYRSSSKIFSIHT